jgi:hypothetical protein
MSFFSAFRCARRSSFSRRLACLARSRLRFAWVAFAGLGIVASPGGR